MKFLNTNEVHVLRVTSYPRKKQLHIIQTDEVLYLCHVESGL